jgi:D-arabinose 1-dehydrogenase-like Zn-dependent alcohol dehydrogenase
VDQMTGYRVKKWGRAPVWEPAQRPAPAGGEVLVEVEACGVGLTVLNCINGDLADDPALLPRVPGHELVGRVVQTGDDIAQDLLGRRVVAYFYLFCGVCRYCVAGRESRCANLAGWVGVHRDGGYAPYTVLPARNALPIPDELDPVTATVVPDAVATPVHVCGNRAQLGPADRVVVIGAGGGVGAHLVQVARLHGAQAVALDVVPAKLEALEALGLRAVDGRELPAAAARRLWPAGPPTAVVDLVGTEETLRWSSEVLGMGGRLVMLTTFRDRSFAVDPRALVFNESVVIGSRYASRAEVLRAAELVARGDVQPVIGEVAGPERVLELHARLEQGALLGRVALTWGPEQGGNSR